MTYERSVALKSPTQIIEEDVDRILNTSLDWHAFGASTVLVTGANGCLPAYIVETLLHLSHTRLADSLRVVALVRSRSRAEARFMRWLGFSQFFIIEQDVCEPLIWPGAIDYVVHAASLASPKHYGSNPIGTAMPNIVGTINLLELAVDRGCRGFLYFSSAEVYGTSMSDMGITETSFSGLDPTLVRSCYAESKRIGETLCVAYGHQRGLRTIIVRPFHTYGPGMALDDGRVFADFVQSIVLRRNIVLNSAGTAQRAFCYLSDSTSGFFTALLSGKSATAYNVGNPQGVIAIRDLAAFLISTFHDRNLSLEFGSQVQTGYITSLAKNVIPDISRLMALGWRPQINMLDGFKRTVEYYDVNR
jgi:UDP-glucuronate decarboxylase